MSEIADKGNTFRYHHQESAFILSVKNTPK